MEMSSQLGWPESPGDLVTRERFWDAKMVCLGQYCHPLFCLPPTHCREKYKKSSPPPPPGYGKYPLCSRNKCIMQVLTSLQWSPTLCNPMDYSPPGFSVHGILQARILEWVAISFFIRSYWFISCLPSLVTETLQVSERLTWVQLKWNWNKW